jgi:hypothetical protein
MSNIGRVIYGYCQGYFGRDHYETCRIEAEGVDWIVVREIYRENARAEFRAFDDEKEKRECIEKWSQKEEE